MIKCRGRCRLLLTRNPRLKAAMKTIPLISLFLVIFLYFHVKQEKEILIDMALGGSLAGTQLVKADNDTIIINGLTIRGTEKTNKVKGPFIVIVVTSLPENFHRREIIRSTWAKKAQDHGTTVVFFLGKPTNHELMRNLVQETHQYQDLIIDDFHESYYALAVKTLRVLKYFKFHHAKSRFLVKTDDDVFVNVPNLVQYCYSVHKRLEGKRREEEEDEDKPDYFIGGVIHSGRGPHTLNPFSKWYAPTSLWNSVYSRVYERLEESEKSSIREDTYPPYAEGNFYVLSSDAVIDILNVSKSVPLYHLEDVHVTGVLATWLLKIEKEEMPYISSSSNFFPKLSYLAYKLFTASPKDVIAFHCDNHVELISIIYKESV